MREELLEFQWDLHVGGYEWIETTADFGDSESGLFLTDGQPFGSSGFDIVRCNPLALYSGLFMEFAETKEGLEGIKAFADKYGPLGGDVGRSIVLPAGSEGSKQVIGTGEHLSKWTKEILTIRPMVALWEKARSGDAEGLDSYITWDDDSSAVRYDSHPELGPKERSDPPFVRLRDVIASDSSRRQSVDEFHPNDLIKPALYCVQRHINEKLKERVSPRLLWNKDHSQLRLFLVPGSLIGALWLQFANAIESDNNFRTCEVCGTWFELAPGKARSDKSYCTNACRTKAYRRRKKEVSSTEQ